MTYQYPPASLASLPTELRLLIFQHTFQSGSNSNSRIEVRRHNTSASKKPTRTNWALLHVNSQIRREVHPLFFAWSDFHFYDTLTFELMQKFLETLGAEAIGWMKTLYFHTKGKCTMFGLELGSLPSFSAFSDGWLSDTFSSSSDYCLRDLHISLPLNNNTNPNTNTNISTNTDTDTNPHTDIFHGLFATRLWTNHNPSASRLCSNGAFGCRERSYAAFKDAGLLDLEGKGGGGGEKLEVKLTGETVMRFWEVMTRDNCSSVA